MSDTPLVNALVTSLPTVMVCSILLLMFLATQTVRVVLPGERLIVRRRGGERVAGPGLRLVWPGTVQTRLMPARILTRHVNARAVATGDGAPATWGAQVDVLVGADSQVAELERDVDISTRRALRRAAHAGGRGAGSSTPRLRRELADELSRRGLTLVDVRADALSRRGLTLVDVRADARPQRMPERPRDRSRTRTPAPTGSRVLRVQRAING